MKSTILEKYAFLKKPMKTDAKILRPYSIKKLLYWNGISLVR